MLTADQNVGEHHKRWTQKLEVKYADVHRSRKEIMSGVIRTRQHHKSEAMID